MQIEVGDRFELTATQLMFICNKAIEDFCEALQRRAEGEENGVIYCEPLNSLEYAREAMCDWIEEHPGCEASKPCNSAKARKALESVKRAIDNGVIGPVGNYPSEELGEKAKKIYDSICESLSAPIRNCDKYETYEEATEGIKAYLAADPGRWNHTAFASWVFKNHVEDRKDGIQEGAE